MMKPMLGKGKGTYCQLYCFSEKKHRFNIWGICFSSISETWDHNTIN